MKKFLLLLAFAALSLIAFAGCGNESTPTTAPLGTAEHPVRVGVTAGPQAVVMDRVKQLAAKDNFHIQVVEFSDFVTPNIALVNGDIEMNSYQHQPYLDNFNAGQGDKLAAIGNTVLLPMAIFSQRYDSLDAIPDGAQVAIPNDPTNGGRALLVLQAAGLVQLKEGAGITVNKEDIVANPKHLQILELEAAQIPRSLSDTDFAVVNTNYAVEVGMNPVTDALFIEPKKSPYACVLVVRKEEKDNPAYQKVREYYQKPEVAEFVKEQFKGSILPAF